MPKENPFTKYLTAENKAHIAVAEYLALNRIRFVHAPLEGKKSAFERFLFNLLGGAHKKGFPDFAIHYARKGWHGLVIELKAQNKDSKWGATSAEQKDWLFHLTKEGYMAKVCNGFDESRNLIKWYFDLKF